MNRLALAGLRHHWRIYLLMGCGVALTCALLVGALGVGDCLKSRLHSHAIERLGQVTLGFHTGDRPFRTDLATDLAREINAPVTPLLTFDAVARRPDGDAGSAATRLVGCDQRLSALVEEEANIAPGDAWISPALATRLHLSIGDPLIVRFQHPDALPREAALTDTALQSVQLRVQKVLSPNGLGRFFPWGDDHNPSLVYTSLTFLQQRAGVPQKSNELLIGGNPDPALVEASLERIWQLEDIQLTLRDIPGGAGKELSTARILFDSKVGQEAVAGKGHALPIWTWFVDAIEAGGNTIPYSIVTAVDGSSGRSDALPLAQTIPTLSENEIALNQWAADDLGATIGDPVTLRFNRLDSGRKRIPAERKFSLKAILPMKGPSADPALMPFIKGISDAETCHDWDPGFPIDLARIRKVDEAYWNEHRGTPKAFVNLSAGRAMWESRYGALTAVRYPTSSGQALKLREKMGGNLSVKDLGWTLISLRDRALSRAEPATDFGMLFLGFTSVLILSALMLTTLLFVFGLERRQGEIGTMLSLGFQRHQVRRLFYREATLVAAIGCLFGTVLSVPMTKAVLMGLGSTWQEAAPRVVLAYDVRLWTLATGASIAFVLAVLSSSLGMRTWMRKSIRALLHESDDEGTTPKKRGQWSAILACCFFLIAGALVVTMRHRQGPEVAAAFFGAGGAVLVAILFCFHRFLHGENHARTANLAPWLLGIRSSSRRPGRSLAVMALLALGCFLVVGVGASGHGTESMPGSRATGTGGFALVGSSTLPIHHDLQTEEGRQALGLSQKGLPDWQVVPLRVRRGDDASCKSLGQAQVPILMGVKPSALDARGAFAFKKTTGEGSEGWRLLQREAERNVVPAIGDEATVVWGLHLGVGEKTTYIDERGHPFQVEIVGIIANSVLQGGLLISEKHFLERFPSESGVRRLLIDVDAGDVAPVRNALHHALEDAGLELIPATEKLAEFSAVENTYLQIFGALGGLGLLLGCVGVGIVLARNVVERRKEIAILSAVGFTPGGIKWMLLCEHWVLLVGGILCGLAAALVGLWPSIGGSQNLPMGSITALLVSMVFLGIASTWVTATLVLRFPIIGSLRGD